MRKIEDYSVYKKSHELVLEIYRLTRSFPHEEIFGVTSQMRRTAYSIPANLSEGSVKSEKEFHRYISISLGSAEELKYFIMLSADLGYIHNKTASVLKQRLVVIIKKLNKLLKVTETAEGR